MSRGNSTSRVRTITRTSLKSEVKYVRFCSRFSRVHTPLREFESESSSSPAASTRAGNKDFPQEYFSFRLVNRRRFHAHRRASMLETLPLSETVPFTVAPFRYGFRIARKRKAAKREQRREAWSVQSITYGRVIQEGIRTWKR